MRVETRGEKMSREGRPLDIKNARSCITFCQRFGPEKLSVVLTVRLSPSEVSVLKRLAKENGVTVSEFIRELVRRAINVD